jgi:hypothetical protein
VPVPRPRKFKYTAEVSGTSLHPKSVLQVNIESIKLSLGIKKGQEYELGVPERRNTNSTLLPNKMRRNIPPIMVVCKFPSYAHC